MCRCWLTQMGTQCWVGALLQTSYHFCVSQALAVWARVLVTVWFFILGLFYKVTSLSSRHVCVKWNITSEFTWLFPWQHWNFGGKFIQSHPWEIFGGKEMTDGLGLKYKLETTWVITSIFLFWQVGWCDNKLQLGFSTGTWSMPEVWRNVTGSVHAVGSGST